MSKIMAFIREDLASIEDWYFALLSAMSGLFVPFIGVALAFAGLFSKRHLWRDEQEKHRNLRNFTYLSLILNLIFLVGFILEIIGTDSGTSSELIKLLSHY